VFLIVVVFLKYFVLYVLMKINLNQWN